MTRASKPRGITSAAVRAGISRQSFIDRAIRDAERRLGVPSGWWGTWRDVTNGTTRVRFTGRAWRISVGSRWVSDHDSRSNAVRKAVRL